MKIVSLCANFEVLFWPCFLAVEELSQHLTFKHVGLSSRGGGVVLALVFEIGYHPRKKN